MFPRQHEECVSDIQLDHKKFSIHVLETLEGRGIYREWVRNVLGKTISWVFSNT